MAIQTASLTSTPTTLDSGGSESVWVKNTGNTRVTVDSGGQRTYIRAGRQATVPVAGATAASVLTSDGGSGTISYEVQGTRNVVREGGGVVTAAGTITRKASDVIADGSGTYAWKDGSAKVVFTDPDTTTPDLHLWRDTSFGFTQLRTDKPLRCAEFFLVEGSTALYNDPNAMGELNADTGGGTNMAFLENDVTSVCIRRPAGTGKLQFGQGDFNTLSVVMEVDCSGATTAVPLTVKGVTSQSGDLLVADGSGTKVRVDSAGGLIVDDKNFSQRFRFLASGSLYLQHNATLKFCDINSGTSRLEIGTDGQVEVIGNGLGYIAHSANGTRYKLVPPDGGGAASWVAA